MTVQNVAEVLRAGIPIIAVQRSASTARAIGTDFVIRTCVAIIARGTDFIGENTPRCRRTTVGCAEVVIHADHRSGCTSYPRVARVVCARISIIACDADSASARRPLALIARRASVSIVARERLRYSRELADPSQGIARVVLRTGVSVIADHELLTRATPIGTQVHLRACIPVVTRCGGGILGYTPYKSVAGVDGARVAVIAVERNPSLAGSRAVACIVFGAGISIIARQPGVGLILASR